MNKHGPRCVFPEWIMGLTMQQQSVLMLAARGPDGIAKHHPCKDVVRAYRATVFKAALYGRALTWGEKADSFMSLDLIASESWGDVVKEYFRVVDELPHHYHMHLLHGAQILAYKHPDQRQRHAWLWFYQRACDDAHMNEETEQQMDGRLSDWFQEEWLCVDEGCPQAGTDHVCISQRALDNGTVDEVHFNPSLTTAAPPQA